MTANELIPLMVTSPYFWLGITTALTTGIILGLYIGLRLLSVPSAPRW